MKRSCYQCADRYPGCHGTCPRYTAEDAANERRKAYDRQFGYVDSMPQTTTYLKKTLAPQTVRRPTVTERTKRP